MVDMRATNIVFSYMSSTKMELSLLKGGILKQNTHTHTHLGLPWDPSQKNGPLPACRQATLVSISSPTLHVELKSDEMKEHLQEVSRTPLLCWRVQRL